jgi:hypothetical protein
MWGIRHHRRASKSPGTCLLTLETQLGRQNIEIYEKAVNILEMYFAAEENSDDEGTNDEDDFNDSFVPPSLPQFGLNPIVPSFLTN